MIGFLRGVIFEIGAHHVLLDVQGVGYRIALSPATLATLKANEAYVFYIHEVIREDAHDLYGFRLKEELGLFTQLLAVSGVGPKVAMAILSVGTVDAVRKAIMQGDVETMTSVPGIGKKTAQKIVLGLRGQLAEDAALSSEDSEVMSALQSLGYTASDSRTALKAVSPEYKTASDRLRAALQQLSVL